VVQEALVKAPDDIGLFVSAGSAFHLQVLVPQRIVGETALGHQAASTGARRRGFSIEAFLAERYGRRSRPGSPRSTDPKDEPSRVSWRLRGSDRARGVRRRLLTARSSSSSSSSRHRYCARMTGSVIDIRSVVSRMNAFRAPQARKPSLSIADHRNVQLVLAERLGHE